jgi:hypothetical protein
MFINPWVYDLEVYSNLFTAVARKLDSKEYVKFVVGEHQDDSKEFIKWLGNRPTLIGYNSINFDGQIVEFIYRRNKNEFTATDVYDFVQTLPLNNPGMNRFDVPYSEWNLSFKSVDLMKINHFDGKVSLKWLEFTTRWPKLKDLPVSHLLPIPKSKIVEVVRYNTNDVDMTYNFYYQCLPMVELRVELIKKFKQPTILNKSNSSFGAYIFEHILTKQYGLKKKDLKKGTRHERIYGKDILLPHIHFESPEFQKVHDTFKNRVYENPDEGNLEKVSGGIYTQNTLFQDMIFVFGSGGLHACWKAGEFKPADDELVMSVDVTSFYPMLGISNGFFPTHIGKMFCKIYKEVFDTRVSYPKGSILNYAYKIALNAVYGKSNSVFSIFYDLMYLLKIVVNGQLLLAMLAEQLSKLGRLLLVNTDGIEIIIKKKDLAKVKELCGQWEIITDLELEYDFYEKLVIRDVNNYIGKFINGKTKRKGVFEMYQDIIGEDGAPHQYDKTPNSTVISKAIWNFYMEDVPIYDTISKENNIYEFCFGIKKTKDFEYWLITSNQGVIDIDKRFERVLRYYISPKGANIYKFWPKKDKGNIQGVNKGQLVTLAMSTVNPEIERMVKRGKVKDGTLRTDLVVQYDVNKDYYVREAEAMVDYISAGTRDTPYRKYMKAMEKLEKEQQISNQIN